MSEYNFEEFKSVGSRYSMVISLGKSDRFYLSSSFCRKYNIASMEGVKLFYDKEKQAVGFKFVTTKEEGSIKLNKLQNDESYYINAKAFLGMYDIPASMYAGRYEPKEIQNGEEKIFVIDLKINL